MQFGRRGQGQGQGQPAPCRAFASAAGCRYGASCRYLHDGVSRPPQQFQQQPQQFLQQQPQPQQQSSQPVCRSFSSPQGCRFGNECRFAHVLAPPSPPQHFQQQRSFPPQPEQQQPQPRQHQQQQPAPLPHRQAQEVCRTFATSGSCRFGSDCRFLHAPSSQQPAFFQQQQQKHVQERFQPSPPQQHQQQRPGVPALLAALGARATGPDPAAVAALFQPAARSEARGGFFSLAADARAGRLRQLPPRQRQSHRFDPNGDGALSVPQLPPEDQVRLAADKAALQAGASSAEAVEAQLREAALAAGAFSGFETEAATQAWVEGPAAVPLEPPFGRYL